MQRIHFRGDNAAAADRGNLHHVPADRVTLTTDCGMKPLPRKIAQMKLQALTQGAAMVRQELGVRGLVTTA